jgi:branched-subunit amino acid aminotransferase/4-amino-4-deoxychorismate lyase
MNDASMAYPMTNNEETTTTALSSTISSPDVQILTTLQYHFFNDQDVRNEDDPTSERFHLINTWKALNATLLGLHARRVHDAALALGWTTALPAQITGLDLEVLIEQAARDQLFRPHGTTSPPDRGGMVSARVRVLVSQTGVASVELVPLGPAPAPNLELTLRSRIENYTANPFESMVADTTAPPPSRVVVDRCPTQPSVFTMHKTTKRQVYDEARGRADPPLLPTTVPTQGEVLVVSPAGEIMEASMSSVYFLRAGRWVTPRASAGGMQSVTRTYALEKGWCVEAVVERESIREGEVIWLGNAVRGFFPGRIHLQGQNGVGDGQDTR